MRSAGVILYMAVILGILLVVHHEATANAASVTIEVVPAGD